MYLHPNKYHRQFLKSIEKNEHPLIIFIGCSMEEDEVLSFLDTNSDDTQYYALMKYDDNGRMDEELQSRNQIIHDYYEQQGIQYIWYGDKFSDLPESIAEIVHLVHDSEGPKVSSLPDLEKTLLSSCDKKKFLNKINSALQAKEYYQVDLIFAKYGDLKEELRIRNLKYAFDSELSENNLFDKYSFDCFWKCINENFEHMDQNFQKQIFEVIRDTTRWTNVIANVFIDISLQFTSGMSEDRRAAILNDVVGKYLANAYIDQDIDDPVVRCLWLGWQLKNGKNVSMPANQIVGRTFNFDRVTFTYLLNSLDELSRSNLFSEISWLMENTSANLLKELLAQGSLTYENEKLFPNEFYKNKLVQRVLINLDSESSLEKEVVMRLENNIDFTDRLLGAETNNFVKKHHINTGQSEDFYVDASSSSEMHWVQNAPYFKVGEITSNREVLDLVAKLNELPDKNLDTFDTNDPYFEANLEGQNKNIKEVLNTDEQWEKFEDENFDFIESVIKSPKLLKHHWEVVSSMLTTAIRKGIDVKSLTMNFLYNLLSMKISIFNLQNKKLLLEAMKNFKDEDNSIWNFMFEKTIVNNLQGPGDNEGFIDLNGFINSELGIYYTLIEDVKELVEKNHYTDKLIVGIQAQDEKLRDYLEGMFDYLFKMNEAEVSSVDRFIGFSHHYRMAVFSEEAAHYEKTVCTLLNSKYFDEFIAENMAKVMVSSLLPDKYEAWSNIDDCYAENQVKDRILIVLLNSFLAWDNIGKWHFSEWIQWFASKYPKAVNTIISTFLRQIADARVVRVKQLLNIIEKAPIHEQVLNEYIFSYIPGLSQLDVNYLKVIGNTVEVVLTKRLIEVNPVFVNDLEGILEVLSNRGLNDTVQSILTEAQNILPGDDMTKLRGKIL